MKLLVMTVISCGSFEGDLTSSNYFCVSKIIYVRLLCFSGENQFYSTLSISMFLCMILTYCIAGAVFPMFCVLCPLEI